MSLPEKSRNKDIVSFHRLCKDLHKFIQKRIIKKYINPKFNNESPNNSINQIITTSKDWTYCNSKEKITEEEKIIDLFKDNSFLSKLKIYYESLENIINAMDENEKNLELLKKDINVGEKKLAILSKLNVQLNQLFNKMPNVQQNNNSNVDNHYANKNIALDRINLVKSLNILNELEIFKNNNEENAKVIKNSNTTSNTTITNNNNIILDNKIINNNIREAKPEQNKGKEVLQLKEESKEKNNNNNNIQNNNSNPQSKKKHKNKKKKNKNPSIPKLIAPQNSDIQLLNKKTNRIEPPIMNNNKEIFMEIPNQPKQSQSIASLINPTFINSNNNNNNNNPMNNNEINNVSNNNINNSSSSQIKNEITSNHIELDNNQEMGYEKVDNPEKIENNSNMNPPSPMKEDVDIPPQIEESKIENPENYVQQTNLEQELEKILKEKFSYVFDIPEKKIPKQKKELINEITQIIKKTRNLKFNRKNKFDDPYLVGSYSHFSVISLMDYVPPIDIMFKCNNIRSVNELKEIASETMKKKMGFNYIELSNDYDKKNEMVKFCHKCKISKGQKDSNNLFILFNIFFVGVNLNNFVQKEQSINRFLFNNNGLYDKTNKILICLYFRRWRKKYNLLFMMPEFLDIIINFYYTEKNNITFIIEEIFLDLFNGHFQFFEKKEEEENDNINAAEDVENMKEIKQYILEWYNNDEYKKKMCDAILDTQELLMNSKFSSTFCCDKDI